MTIDEALDELGLVLPRSRKLPCPDHYDKTASLHVYADHFYCFSCAKHGDAFGLIALFQGKPVEEVLRTYRPSQGDGLSRRRATAGRSLSEFGRYIDSRWREMYSKFWSELAGIMQNEPLWVVEQRIALFGDVFDEFRDWLLGSGLYHGEDRPAPAEAERRLDEFETELKQILDRERGYAKH